jgi:hypothetical protein
MADIMRGDEAVDDNSGMRMRRGRAGWENEAADESSRWRNALEISASQSEPAESWRIPKGIVEGGGWMIWMEVKMGYKKRKDEE